MLLHGYLFKVLHGIETEQFTVFNTLDTALTICTIADGLLAATAALKIPLTDLISRGTGLGLTVARVVVFAVANRLSAAIVTHVTIYRMDERPCPRTAVA
jgi:hypothetical protein